MSRKEAASSLSLKGTGLRRAGRVSAGEGARWEGGRKGRKETRKQGNKEALVMYTSCPDSGGDGDDDRDREG